MYMFGLGVRVWATWLDTCELVKGRCLALILLMYAIVTRALAGVNNSAEAGDASQLLAALQSDLIEVGTIDESCAERYQAALTEARRNNGEELSQEEIRKVIEDVNEEVRLERLSE